MIGIVKSSCIINKEPYGAVEIVVRSNMKSIRGSWNKGRFRVSVPAGVSFVDIDNILNKWKETAIQNAPWNKNQSFYDFNRAYVFDYFSFELRTSDKIPFDRVGKSIENTKHLFTFSESRPNDITLCNYVTDAAIKLAKVYSKVHLIDEAKAECDRLGIAPAGWKIGSGRRTLGTCSPGKIVTLSCCLMFMPAILRKYVICHELAHLTYMNHSAGFHSLLNDYLDGRESELIRMMKQFRWPVKLNR